MLVVSVSRDVRGSTLRSSVRSHSFCAAVIQLLASIIVVFGRYTPEILKTARNTEFLQRNLAWWYLFRPDSHARPLHFLITAALIGIQVNKCFHILEERMSQSTLSVTLMKENCGRVFHRNIARCHGTVSAPWHRLGACDS